MDDLFAPDPPPPPRAADATRPLAERMRPRRLRDLVGQDEALGADTPLGRALTSGRLPSLVLWGPPGCGKTTLARCLAAEVGATLLEYSAVRVGIKELKGVMAEAAKLRAHGTAAPLLFLDEIHRFNKAQQDALLPHVEAGDVILIGATTENPSFQVNAALLSRCRLVVLAPLAPEAVVDLLRRATDDPRGLGDRDLEVTEDALEVLARRSGGDARFALGNLDLAATVAREEGVRLDATLADRVLAQAPVPHDRAGDRHFDLISALQKSVRNSDAQAGVYWLARILEGGEDPLYVARRLVRIASEDVGLAEPRALEQAVSATRAVQQLGMPEGALALAQATVFLAQAPKSNALETGYLAAVAAIRDGATDPVPLHLRNAPTAAMKELGYGDGYHYSHDAPGGVSAMECLPSSLAGTVFYRPTDRGFEAEAAERLRAAWRRAHPQSDGSQA